MGVLIRAFFPEQPIWTLAIAGVLMALSALATLRVGEPGTEATGIAAEANLAL